MLIPAMSSLTFRNKSIEQVIALAQATGLAAIEWGSDIHVPPMDEGAILRARRGCEAAGIAISDYATFYSPFKYEDYLGEFERIAVTCNMLGTKAARVWIGDRKRCFYPDDIYLQLVDRMGKIADAAKAHGLTLILEMFDRTVCDSGTNLRRFLDDLSKDNVKATWRPLTEEFERNRFDLFEVQDNLALARLSDRKNGQPLSFRKGVFRLNGYLYMSSLSKTDVFCIVEDFRDDNATCFIEDARFLSFMTSRF